jgi:hypothetical protein
VKLFDTFRRAWGRHDERLADAAVREGTAGIDAGAAAEGEYDAMRAGGLMGPRSDELEREAKGDEPG